MKLLSYAKYNYAGFEKQQHDLTIQKRFSFISELCIISIMFSINIPKSNQVIYMFLLVILMNKKKKDFFILKLDCKQVYTGTSKTYLP